MFDNGDSVVEPGGWVPDHGPARRWSLHRPNGLLGDEMVVSPLPTGEDAAGEEYALFDQLERAGGWEHVIAWGHAQQLRDIAGVVVSYWRIYRQQETEMSRSASGGNGQSGSAPRSGPFESEVWDAVVAEVGLMLGVSSGTAGRRVGLAVNLMERLPRVLAALQAGRINVQTAEALSDETLQLGTAQAAKVAEGVMASHSNRTPGSVRAAARRAVAKVDPDAVARRARAARKQRDVWLEPEADGMAGLHAHLPAEDATAIFAVLDAYARRAACSDDGRTQSERRADALTDVVLPADSPEYPAASEPAMSESAGAESAGTESTGAESAVPDRVDSEHTASRDSSGNRPAPHLQVQVRVTVAYTTLLGLDEYPAELAGYGPLPADAARKLAGQGTWRRVLTDPATGGVIEVGNRRYRPPAALAEHVINRDQRCDFPGCRVPAHRCDLDHTRRFDARAGTGPTDAENLRARCRRHHRIKHLPGWSVSIDSEGAAVWSTPTGHTYRTRPHAPPERPEPTRPVARRRLDSHGSSFPDEPPF